MSQASRSPAALISAVVSDVDGTLVTDDKVLTPRVAAAVAGLGAACIPFTIISSRPLRGIRPLIEALRITRAVGCFNGGVIATPDGTIHAEHLLPIDVAQRAVDMITAAGAAPWLFCGQDWIVRHSDDPYISLEQRTVGFPPTLVDDFSPYLGKAAKIVGSSADFDVLARCEGDMQTALAGRATVARSQPYYLDITHPLANKGEALAAIANLLGVPLAEIAVLGDARNDVIMFQRSGLAIAVDNAVAEVKEAADFITASNADDGFALAVEKIILGRARPRISAGLASGGDIR
ncbi:MAG: HAD-superfamily hydrolase [Bradyrhizobium sp.]|nr:HAD-superfamily hydrolase [Bradyrhizobium sp.]